MAELTFDFYSVKHPKTLFFEAVTFGTFAEAVEYAKWCTAQWGHGVRYCEADDPANPYLKYPEED